VGPSAFGTRVWFTNKGNNTVADADQIVGDQSINSPSQIVAGPDGAMWFTNTGNSGDTGAGSIGWVTIVGRVTERGPGRDVATVDAIDRTRRCES